MSPSCIRRVLWRNVTSEVGAKVDDVKGEASESMRKRHWGAAEAMLRAAPKATPRSVRARIFVCPVKSDWVAKGGNSRCLWFHGAEGPWLYAWEYAGFHRSYKVADVSRYETAYQ